MKIYSIKWTWLLILCSFPAALKAQAKLKKNITTVVVHISDESLSKKDLTLSVIRDYTYANSGATEYSAKADNKGNFAFSIPGLKQTVKIAIYFENFGFIDSYLEPGDNIRIEYKGKGLNGEIKKEDLLFYGKGSFKFIVIQDINVRIPDNLVRIKEERFNHDFLNSFFGEADSTYYFKKRILNAYKKQISSEIYQKIDADIFANSYFAVFFPIGSFYINNAEYKKDISAYYSKIENRKYLGLPAIAAQSSSYLVFLLEKAKASCAIKKGSWNIKIKDIYQELLIQNTGVIREKVLLYFLLQNSYEQKENDIDYVFSDAQNYVHNKYYRQIISNLGKAMRKGADAYKFSLPDTTGNMVSLTDFKGKVIVLDCWFTGCTSCADVSKIVENEVLPRFKDNPNVAFISINVDKSRELWLKSIKTGIYTNSKSVNLYTNGLGLHHPFIEKYQFNGFPQLMLIDKKGKIFTPILPRKSEEMIDVINEALSLDNPKLTSQ